MRASSSGRNGCDIAMLVDEEIGERDPSGSFVVERGSMEQSVLEALERAGSRVRVVPFDPAITPTILELRAAAPRLVFNLTEWVAGDRRLDAAIASVLDMMALRYTGTGPAGLQLARDKALAKSIVADLGIGVPHHVLVNGRRTSTRSLTYPAIVKPQFGDGSEGIARAAFVRSERQLRRRIEAIRRHSDEPLLCEAFVPGRDLFVGMVGNEPRVMPPLELVVGRDGAGAPRFATATVKNDAAYRRKWGIRYRRARLADDVLAAITQASQRIFRALKLRDYARIDYRLTPENELVFLEANPNPDLTPHTFGRGVCFAGMRYDELIRSIVSSALAR